MWGVCYEVSDNDTETISSINHRERRFIQMMIPFYPYSNDTNPMQESSFSVSVYMGALNGPLFLGEATEFSIAKQVFNAVGPSGPNSEYILNLANFMRQFLPHVEDPHLFEIEKELLLLIQTQHSKNIE